tara:strand:- start:17325 stop:17522 length:198 start_codon:yes stop_codon:yes gene_type:complete
MVVINKLVTAMVILVVLILLLVMFYSDDGFFTKIKEKILGIGDNVPGLPTEDLGEEGDDGIAGGS